MRKERERERKNDFRGLLKKREVRRKGCNREGYGQK